MTGYCSDCRFWSSFHRNSDVGECRRFPPALIGEMLRRRVEVDSDGGAFLTYDRQLDASCYPATVSDDGCGEFSERVAE